MAHLKNYYYRSSTNTANTKFKEEKKKEKRKIIEYLFNQTNKINNAINIKKNNSCYVRFYASVHEVLLKGESHLCTMISH